MPNSQTCLASLALCTLLGACASAGGPYPSLAIRDAERVTGSAQPVTGEVAPPLPPPPLDASIGQRIAQTVERARKAHASFTAGIAKAASTISAARGSSASTDTWVSAQVALAELQSLRSDTVIAQADLDGIYAAERLADPERITPTAEAVASALARIADWVSTQDRAIAHLAAQLGT
jgi:hypothetical protein